MLQTIMRMDKIAALRQVFLDRGMLVGSTSSYMAGVRAEEDFAVAHIASGVTKPEDEEEDEDGPEPGDPASGVLSIVKLAQRCRKSGNI